MGAVIARAGRLLLVARPDIGALGACRAAREYLTLACARGPSQRVRQDTVIGVWTDGSMVDAPDVLDRACLGARTSIRIHESVGVNGCWSLYWLVLDGRGTASDLAGLREQIVAALMTASIQRGSESWQFAPVFDPLSESRDVARAGRDRLTRLFPGVIGESIFWNAATGPAVDRG